jgi:hypothetical protein
MRLNLYLSILLVCLVSMVSNAMDRVQCITRTETFNPQTNESVPGTIVLTDAKIDGGTNWKASFDLLRDGRWQVTVDASNEKTPIHVSIRGAKDVAGTLADAYFRRASKDPKNSVQYVNNRSYSLDVRLIRSNQLEFVRCYVCQKNIDEFDVSRPSCVSSQGLETQAKQLGFQFRSNELSK